MNLLVSVYDKLLEAGSMMEIIERLESVEQQCLRKAWEKLVYQPKVLTPRSAFINCKAFTHSHNAVQFGTTFDQNFWRSYTIM